jgi:hypothetical protein
MIRGKIMKNEREENEVLRGPLILLAPASNLVAILSLNWWDGGNRTVVSAEAQSWDYPANRPRKSQVQKRDIDTSRGIDHDVLTTG